MIQDREVMDRVSRRAFLAGAGSSVLLSPAYAAIKHVGAPEMPPHRMVPVNGVRLNVYEAGKGPAIVLLHGFPEVGYTWRKQIRAFVAAGYRVIVPDQHGFGLSDIPKPVEDYDLKHLLGDIAGLLDSLHVDKAVIVGHDWGGILAWQMPLFYPERVAGVIGVSTPFIPHWLLWLQPDPLDYLGPKARAFVPDPRIDPIVQMRHVYSPDQYVLMFNDGTRVADDLMNRDPRRTVALLTQNMMSAAAYAKLPPADHEEAILKPLKGAPKPLSGKPILTAAELDVYAANFKRTGFTPGINWYRNISRNWRAGRDISQSINAPSLMISAENDLVLTPNMAANMGDYIPDLEKKVIANAGHYSHEERPEEFNRVAIEWLKRRFPA